MSLKLALSVAALLAALGYLIWKLTRPIPAQPAARQAAAPPAAHPLRLRWRALLRIRD